ncbi:unnamed protein product, partial [marine sediment metagenome]
LGIYAAAIGLSRFQSVELSRSLLTMTGAHLAGGRAAGMTWGYAHALPAWLVIVTNMAIETYLVLLFFPLFVFSYRRLIVIKPLEETMQRAQQAAEAHRSEIVRYGIPGLLLFVWFPFWMTGPLVGSIIGFLIGLGPWLNVTVVVGGTWAAILCWGLVLNRIYKLVEPIGPYIPLLIVGAIILFAVSIRIRYAFARHPDKTEGPEDQQ